MQPSGSAGGDDHAPSDQPGTGSGSDSDRYTLSSDGLSAHDRRLGRTVAARRVGAEQADQLEQDARFLARLDHPGAATVIDFVRDGQQALLLTRRIDGIRLDQAIVAARAGQPQPELSSPAEVAQLAIRLCEAVAAAHAQQVVHRRLSSGCVLLGSFGQVQLSGWDHAGSERRDPATLRYLSAESRSSVPPLDGLHQDIQALGSILFHCLVLRPPQRTGRDALGPLEPAERERLPDLLEHIVRTAIASDAASGYADAMAMASDLTRFLAGQAPRARRVGLAGRVLHALCRHRVGIAAITVAITAAAGAGALLFHERLSTWLAWDLVAHETFTDATWQERWSQGPGPRAAFETRDGSLVSIADRDALLVFKRRLTTPVAIEYTGQIIPGSQPCDLSVLWSEASGAGDDPGRMGSGPRDYMIQAGAFGNAFCAIFQNPGRELRTMANRQLQPGREHRFRVDIEPDRLRMRIDGETVLDCTEEFATRSGYLALFGFYPGKSFREVRVLQRNEACPPAATDPGDAAFVERSFAAAARRYAQAAEVATRSGDISTALFKQGLAEWNQGAISAAEQAWSRIPDEWTRLRASCYGLGSPTGPRRDAEETGFAALWRERTDMHPELLRAWLRMVQRVRSGPQQDKARLERLLDLHTSLFPDDPPARHVAATTLAQLHRYQECLDRYPEQRLPCADALLALGRPREVLASEWTSFDARIHALTMLGEYAHVLENPGVMPEWRARVLCKLGRSREAVDDPGMRYPALIHAGRAAELLGTPGIAPLAANEALIALGRLDEAAGSGAPGIPGSGGHAGAMLLLGRIDSFEQTTGTVCQSLRFMRAVESGDRTAADRARAGIVLQQDLARYAGWFMPTLAVHVIDALQGDAQALDRIRPYLPILDRTFGRRGWHVARAVLGDAPLESVLAMSTASEATAWRAVAGGMRHELDGEPDAALSAYASFAGLPAQQRLLAVNTLDPDVETFVAWRIRRLQGQRR